MSACQRTSSLAAAAAAAGGHLGRSHGAAGSQPTAAGAAGTRGPLQHKHACVCWLLVHLAAYMRSCQRVANTNWC
jgi:hypothetical protein